MKSVLLICLGVFVILLILGWSLWIGVGLSLYWLVGLKAIKQINKWLVEDGNAPELDSYTDEWVFRGIMIFLGGFMGIIVGCMSIHRYWEKKETYKSWFD